MANFLSHLSNRFYNVVPEVESLGEEPGRIYKEWISKTEPLLVDLVDEQFSRISQRPLISILMPVFNTPPELLKRAIDSVICQSYENWQLCICDDGSTDPTIPDLLKKFCDTNSKIEIIRVDVNSHISTATNAALKLAKGDWISFLDHDDSLAAHALKAVVVEIDRNSSLKMIYSDEDKITEAGVRCQPFFKTDFDRLLILGQNYVNHFLTIKKEEILRVDGLAPGAEGVQDWDLVLKVSENAIDTEICHIPMILYHWGIHSESTASESGVEQKKYIELLGVRIVSEHLDRTRKSADVSLAPINHWVKVKWQLPTPLPKVDIIIPTRDGKKLRDCVSSLLANTSYPNFSVSIIDNGSQKRSTKRFLRKLDALPQINISKDSRPFNFSRLNNDAVRRSTAPIVCLLNDDVEIIDGEWLSIMVGHLLQDGVGVVGAKLLYPDMTIQHAGVVLGINGVAGHVHSREMDLYHGYFGNASLSRNVSCVTGACLLVWRDLWNEIEGLDEKNFSVAFNDVDFCIRVRESGKQVIWSPDAKLVHHESISRGFDTHGEGKKRFDKEVFAMRNKWKTELNSDPFYNPNLSLDHSNYQLGELSRLLAGTWPVSSLFVRGQLLESRDRNIVGEILADQFILKDTNSGSLLWSTGPLGDEPFCLAFQDDGNLVIYSATMSPLWDSKSIIDNPGVMILTDDGILQLQNRTEAVYWSSDKVGY